MQPNKGESNGIAKSVDENHSSAQDTTENE